ncbi:MAG: hypothetical protein WA002_15290, partial [Candidatus Acidiferrales bacterium]
KIFNADARLGFLAQARLLSSQIAMGAIPPDRIASTQRLIFNNRLDALVTAVLAAMVLALLVDALSVWAGILLAGKKPVLNESPYVATRWAEGD